MTKEKVFLWGTGNIARQVFQECLTISLYEIIGFIDNDISKWGRNLFDIDIYSPEFLYANTGEIDRIVVLTNSYKDVKKQIVDQAPELECLIDNKYYFYKRSILERYKNSADVEIRRIIDYLKFHSLDVFNYEFVEKYENFEPDVFKDDVSGLYYVLHDGKKMFFSREYGDIDSVKRYYKSICLEQDIESPHRYLSDNFKVNKGDVVIDVGVAEGNFALNVIDIVKRIYLIEADPLWIEALRYTFKPYKDKVVIIGKYATSYNEGDFSTIDSVIDEKIDFIKMDIEGYEWDALNGAIDTIKNSENIRIAACCYHSDFDQVLIEDFFDKNEFKYSTTSGYMWFPSTCRQSTVSTKLNRGIVRGIKK